MWNFILTDMQFTPIGEITNAQNKNVTLALNKLDTLTFTIRSDNPLANTISSCRGFIKAYRNNVLTYFGPIISAEEDGDEDGVTIVVTSAGAGWILTKRFLNLASPTATDRAVLAANAIRSTESITIGFTLLSTINEIDSYGSVSAGSTVSFDLLGFKPVMDIITFLSAGTSGFDWRVLPREPYLSTGGAPGGYKIGLFSAAPVIGSAKPNAVFEFGPNTRANIVSYKRLVDRSTQANVVYGLQNSPSVRNYTQASDLSDTDWNVLEDLVDTDLTDLSLLTDLLDTHVAVRSEPRVLLDMQPHFDPSNSGRVPSFGVDYDIGDSVRTRVVFGGLTRIDAMLRVWTVSFDIDAAGSERTTLTVVDQ